ncbi:MAG TPA: AsmA family protein [Steroidobacteraceae bacterium]|nr:AsmA family protein [Steroidobacteraceae bacterium]
MRTVKIVAGLVGGIIVLLVAALLAVWVFVNPNDYKGKIAAAVKESTGRKLNLNGDIKLSVFPWVALELGPASLGNPPGFSAEPFLAFNHAAVRVRLLPLLSKRLDIDRVQLDGLDLRLRKNAQGTGNWENFGKSQAAPATPEGGTSASLSRLAGIAVTHGRVSYQGMVVENIQLETGAFGGRGITPVSLKFDANRGVPGESLSFEAKFSLDADPAAKQFKLAAVSLSGMLGRANDGGPEHWEMTAPAIEANLGAQTLAVPAFAMSYSSARVTGKLQATKIIDDLSMTGSVALAPLVLREFAPRLGIALPKTGDPRALSQFSAAGDFSYAASGMRFENMQIQLDDSHLKGSVALLGEPRALKFDLAVDKIDLDRYLPGASGAPAAAPKAAAGSPAAAKADAAKPMDANGTLTLGAVHFSPLDLTSVRFTLASKGGVMRLFPSQALIDGGRYSGDITVDTRGATPALSLDEHLSGIDMTRLLANTSYKGRLSGHGNVNLKATARGAALDPVLKSLNGHFDANLTGGAIEGMDIAYEFGAAQALIHREAPTGTNTKRTAFDAFKMSAEITNGVAKTSDLLISSPVLRVKGQGSANLPTKAIDFQVVASLLRSATSTVADIPMKITGTYVDPTVRPHVEALAKGQVKQKLQDLLQKKGLKGLFSK